MLSLSSAWANLQARRHAAHTRKVFLRSLDIDGVRYEVGPKGILVHGDLRPWSPDVSELPDHLTITGSLMLTHAQHLRLPANLAVYRDLDMSRSLLPKLPQGLMVGRDLNMDQTQIEELPAELSVGRHIQLAQGQIRRLPEAFHVAGDLDLSLTGIETLPMGLRVGGQLNLRGTPIRTLPPEMQVGGPITPSARLDDIRSFLDGRRDRVVLTLSGSQHERLFVRQQLQSMPDLWRVVASMPAGSSLHLWTDPTEGYGFGFHHAPY